MAVFTRAKVAAFHDAVMAGLAFLVALYLRLGDTVFLLPRDFLAQTGLVFVGVAVVSFAVTGVQRTNWRFVSLTDLLVLVRGVTLAILMFLAASFLVSRLETVPRSSVIIAWFVLLLFVSLPRIAYRLLREGYFDPRRATPADRLPVLLVGRGESAELYLRATRSRSGGRHIAVGILDDKLSRRGEKVHGVPVLGSIDELPRILENLAARSIRPVKLVVTDAATPRQRIADLLEMAERHGMTIGRAPSPTALQSGLGERPAVENIAIEDLLGRAQTRLDPELPALQIRGRRVLITGAGGSIGSEIVRQVASFGPARLVLLDAGEFNLYAIDHELAEKHPELDRRAVLADVRHRGQLDRLLTAEKPEVIFHAAAYKHVPLIEENPVEGAWTNVLGTRHLADLAVAHGVAAMVMISTDKAVNPTNVMGATKRLAECYCQTLDLTSSTRFVTVRFGNVLGSTGSVVPLFKRQLSQGGPLTVTHADITRYFMTIAEAVSLVLQALGLRLSDPEAAQGKIYVLDMGEPVKIIEVARQMIRLAGLVPHRDIEIKVVGLRPGEKMTEELFYDDETLSPTRQEGILLASPRLPDRAALTEAIAEVEAAAQTGDVDRVLATLSRLVPGFVRGEEAPPPALPVAGKV